VQIGGTGTVPQNSLNKILIIVRKDMEKNIVRGTSQALYKSNQVLIAWKDKWAVYMES
jgi:hypothetical protein